MPNNDSRKSILDAISDWLKLLALIVLVMEAFLTTAILATEDNDALYVFCGIGLLGLIAVGLFYDRYLQTRLSVEIQSRGRGREAKNRPAQRMRITDVITLGPGVRDVLREKQQSENVGRKIRILTADAGNLFGYMETIITAKWLRKASFQFAIVDPDFNAIDEGGPLLRRTAEQSLMRIEELSRNPELAAREINILPTRMYKYFPNTWGVLIDNSDLFIGFHNWVPHREGAKLEGTQHGIVHLKKGNPLWDRFYDLFISWFEHSEEKE